jgi:hypothetical protein
VVALAIITSACRASIDDMPEVYYRGPGSRVLCATSVDNSRASFRSIEAGLARAARDGAILQLYAHTPGATISHLRLHAVLDRAADLGLATVTYRELADGAPARAGLALSFDDDAVDAWHGLAPLFDAYGARATFFVSGYRRLDLARRAKLRELAARGHAIEAHSADHPHLADGHPRRRGRLPRRPGDPRAGRDARRWPRPPGLRVSLWRAHRRGRRRGPHRGGPGSHHRLRRQARPRSLSVT